MSARRTMHPGARWFDVSDLQRRPPARRELPLARRGVRIVRDRGRTARAAAAPSGGDPVRTLNRRSTYARGLSSRRSRISLIGARPRTDAEDLGGANHVFFVSPDG